MNREELREIIKEYIKDNLRIELDVSDRQWANGKDVSVKLFLDYEEIASAYETIDIPERETGSWLASNG